MIDAFFELSLLESDTSQIELEAVEITSLLLQTVLEQESLIKERGLEIPKKQCWYGETDSYWRGC